MAKQGSIDTGTPKISRHFNPSSSTTIKNTYETFRITYGTGSCNGAYYYDNLKYINEKIYMKFGVAEKTFGQAIKELKVPREKIVVSIKIFKSGQDPNDSGEVESI